TLFRSIGTAISVRLYFSHFSRCGGSFMRINCIWRYRAVLILGCVAFLSCNALAGEYHADPDLLAKLRDGKFDQLPDTIDTKIEQYCLAKTIQRIGIHLREGLTEETGYSYAEFVQGTLYWEDPRMFAFPWMIEENSVRFAALVDQKGADSAEIQSIMRNNLKLVISRGLERKKQKELADGAPPRAVHG